jgi:hypothetical protein
MAFPTNVDATWVNPGSVSLDAGELRRADSAIFGGDGAAFSVRGGIVRHGDTSLAVTVDGSDVVTVQPGAVVIPGNAVSGSGCYRAALSAATTGSLTARNATNPRVDLLVFRQMDTDVVAGHGAYTARIELIAGTPSATPSAPSLPSMAVELARITVPATGGGSATVDSTFRTYAVGLGGILPVPTSARLPVASPTGQHAIALDTQSEYVWNGSAWTPAAGPGWVSYSPVLTNLSVGNGTVTARYRVLGTKTVAGWVRFAGGSTSTYTGGLTFRVPATFAPGSVSDVIGNGYMHNGSGATRRLVAVVPSGTQDVVLVYEGGTANATGPFAAGANTLIAFNYLYEIA